MNSAQVELKAGELVRVTDTGSRGRVIEVDYSAVLVDLSASGVERWFLADDLERVVPWYLRGQEADR